MATTGKKRGRKPSVKTKSGKMITKKCSTAGSTLKKSTRKTAKSRAGRTLGRDC